MKTILALETSQHALSVALQDRYGVRSTHIVEAQQQARDILVVIDALLVDAGIRLSSLDAISLGYGPGSFTGLRIAAGITQGLAFAANLPVIPISSLQCIAQGIYVQQGHRAVAVAMDARLDEVYWGEYTLNEQQVMMPLVQERVVKPEQVTVSVAQPWFGVGNGFLNYRGRLPVAPLGTDEQSLPRAEFLLVLANYYYDINRWIRAQDVAPSYLRDTVVG